MLELPFSRSAAIFIIILSNCSTGKPRYECCRQDTAEHYTPEILSEARAQESAHAREFFLWAQRFQLCFYNGLANHLGKGVDPVSGNVLWRPTDFFSGSSVTRINL